MGTSISSLWNRVISSLKNEISYSSFETWFQDVRPLALTDQALTIAVPDAFTKGGLERRYREKIEQLVADACETPVSLVIEVSEAEPARAPRVEFTPKPADSLALCPDYRFDSFVRGKNCDLAYYASEAVAERPGIAYNPLFLYGNVGLGKTHLLHAIGNRLTETVPDASIVYTTSERFAIELISAIRNNSTAAFRNKYREIDLLLIDDVHFLEGKEATQEELFHTFNELYGSEKQIVLTSDRAPEDLSGLQERLVSRFRWGLVADIQRPDLETRIAILRQKAASRGIEIDVGVLEMIATRISSNVRTLEGALTKVLAFSDLRGVQLTPLTLEGMLPKEGQLPRLTLDAIKDKVATVYKLKRQDLEGSSRKKEIARARHIAIYLAREMTDQSFPSIGRAFGNRDHTTVMHSHTRVKEMLDETPLLYTEIGQLRESLASTHSTLRERRA